MPQPPYMHSFPELTPGNLTAEQADGLNRLARACVSILNLNVEYPLFMAPHAGSYSIGCRQDFDPDAVPVIVRFATAAPLAAHSVSGDTITASANAAISVDGRTPSQGDKILVKDQTTFANNGPYIVVQVGTGALPFILQRSGDKLTAGMLFMVAEGINNKCQVYKLHSADPITPGTTDQRYSMVGRAPYADAATTTPLPAYTVGTDGTLTMNSNGALASTYTDGVTPALGMILLVKNEPSAYAYLNRPYYLSVLGTAGTPAVLKPFGPLVPGMPMYVAKGKTLGGAVIQSGGSGEPGSTAPMPWIDYGYAYSAPVDRPKSSELPLKEATGSILVDPLSGTAYTGTDLTWSSTLPRQLQGKPGAQSIQHNGTSTKTVLEGAAYLATLTNATFACHFMITAYPSTYGLIYCENCANVAGVWGVRISSAGVVALSINETGAASDINAESTMAVALNTWYSVVAIMASAASGDRPAGMSVWLDGKLAATNSSTTVYDGASSGGCNSVTLGCRVSVTVTSDLFFPAGNIAGFERYKGAWTVAQIEAFHKGSDPAAGGATAFRYNAPPAAGSPGRR